MGTDKATRYIVLASIDELGITWDRIGQTAARSQEDATRAFFEKLGGRNSEEVMLVAVPVSSFQPRRPRVRTTLENIELVDVQHDDVEEDPEPPEPLELPEPARPL